MNAPRAFHLSRRHELVLLVVALLLGAFFRLYRLDTIPPGLTHDEADTGYFVKAVYQGSPSQVEAPYGYANELFSMYSGAAFMTLFGPTDLALRLHSAFFGLLMILFCYGWVRLSFSAPAALGAAALIALSFWPVATARFALNPQPAPALFSGAVACLWLALFDSRPGSWRWLAWPLFSLLLAGSLWAYEVARATTAALVGLWGYLLLTDRERMRRSGVWFSLALALGLALAAPHLLDRSAWQRSATLATTLEALRGGDPGPLLKTSLEVLGAFTFRGEPFLPYSIPGRPLFDWPVGLLFYGGLALCLRRWRQPAYFFTLLWIATGLLPSMIVGVWNSTLHSMGMQSVVFVPPALFAAEALGWAGRRWGSKPARGLAVVLVGLILLTGAKTFRDYFWRWGEWPEVRAAYFHNLAAITDYLDQSPDGGTVALSSPFPDLPHDPFIADLRVQRDDLSLGWFDGRRAFLFPGAESARLIVPTNAPLNPRWLDWGLPFADVPPERVLLHPQDIDPYFVVFTWQPEPAWQQVADELTGEIVRGDAPLRLPVDWGAVELIGYRLFTPVVAPGGTVELVTGWRVRDPQALGPLVPQHYGRSAAIFVHLLGPDGQVIGQEDRLDVPAWNWQPGDRFLQIHHFSLDPTLPAGSYALELGVYTRPDLIRLSVTLAGQPLGDRVLLQPAEVQAP